MKRILLSLLLILAPVAEAQTLKGTAALKGTATLKYGTGGGGGSTPTLVTYTKSNASASPSVDTTGANFLVAVIVGNQSLTAPTDSKSNTWTALTEYANSGQGLYVRIFYVANPTVGTGHTFTNTSGNYSFTYVSAWSGMATASPFDAENGQNSVNGTTIQPGSVTPSTTNELFITGFESIAAGTASIDNGFTIQDGDLVGGAPYAWAYKVNSTSTAQNPTWTTTGSSWIVSNMAAFKHQ